MSRRRQPNQRQMSDALLAERDEKIWQLRLQGRSLRQIGLAVGLSHVAVKDVLDLGYAERIYPKVDQARLLELERLDELQHRAWKVLDDAHVTISGGKIVTQVGADGKETPLADDGPVLHAIDRLLRISERRARLIGMDMPTRVEPVDPAGPPQPELLDRIAQARADMEAREAAIKTTPAPPPASERTPDVPR